MTDSLACYFLTGGNAYLSRAAFPTTDEGITACEAFLNEAFPARDIDGGAVAVLGITGAPGASFDVRQGGVIVAVVVRK